MKKVFVLLLLLGVASVASAVEFSWDAGGGADNNWMNAANWNATGYPNTLPTMTGAIAGLAKMYPATNVNILVNSAGPEAFQAKIGGQGGGLTWSTLTVAPGAVLNVGEWFMAGVDSTTGGGRSGQLDMSGGTINLGLVNPASGHLFVGHTGTATKGFINMSGGTINVTGNFAIGFGAGTSGTVIMTGGTINTPTLSRNATATTKLDISGTAKVVIAGDWTANATLWSDSGWLFSNGIAFLDNGGTASFDGNFTTLAVPEPATVCLLGLGVLSLIRRKK